MEEILGGAGRAARNQAATCRERPHHLLGLTSSGSMIR